MLLTKVAARCSPFAVPLPFRHSDMAARNVWRRSSADHRLVTMIPKVDDQFSSCFPTFSKDDLSPIDVILQMKKGCLPTKMFTRKSSNWKKKTRHTQPRSTIETTIIPSLDFWQDVGCPHVTCCFHPLFCTKPPSCNAAWLITSHSAKSNSTLFMTCQNVIVWHILPKCHLNLWWM